MKEKVYKTLVKPVMAYKSQRWALNKKDEIKMKITGTRTLRWMCGETGLNRIKECIYKKKFRSSEHSQRK